MIILIEADWKKSEKCFYSFVSSITFLKVCSVCTVHTQVFKVACKLNTSLIFFRSDSIIHSIVAYSVIFLCNKIEYYYWVSSSGFA